MGDEREGGREMKTQGLMFAVASAFFGALFIVSSVAMDQGEIPVQLILFFGGVGLIIASIIIIMLAEIISLLEKRKEDKP